VRKLFGSKKSNNRKKGKRVIKKQKIAIISRNNDDLTVSGRSGKKWSLRSIQRKHIVYGSLVIVGVLLVTAALRTLLGGVMEDVDARSEYELLRVNFPEIAAQEPQPITENEEEPVEDYTIIETEEEEAERNLRDLSLDELYNLNKDFIGWISAGPSIDYPVVRGVDNEKYINTTFLGHRNTAGTIFMDFRHTTGFDEQVSILYGHNTRDGSMFSALVRFLDQGYLQGNPNITITTRDGRRLTYKVFAARLTDAWDVAYSIGVNDSARASEEFSGAPQSASNFLLLSTCTRNSNDDERILVFAAR